MVKLDLPEKISTDRLLLQKLRYEDAAEIFYAYASKPEATRYVSWPTHTRIEDTVAFLEYAGNAWTLHKDYGFSIRRKDNARLIGSFGVVNHDGDIQFGYILSPSQWNAGFATEVCREMMARLKTLENIKRLFTFVAVENPASSRVLIKSGLKEEGRMPEWFLFPNCGSEKKDCVIYNFPLH